MARDFEKGDKVEWNTPQGKTSGTVKRKLTSRTEVGGQTVAASEPQVLRVGFHAGMVSTRINPYADRCRPT